MQSGNWKSNTQGARGPVAIIVVAATVAAVTILAAWAFTRDARRLQCGDEGRDALKSAVEHLSHVIPDLEFVTYDSGACDSGGSLVVAWTHPDLASLRGSGVAMGCVAPHRVPTDDSDLVLTCPFDGLDAVLYLDLSEDLKLKGSMVLARSEHSG